MHLSDQVLSGSGDVRKCVILISDGIIEGNPTTRGLARSAAAEQATQELWSAIVPALQQARVRVYTLGLMRGDLRGEPTLQRIAEATGGFYSRIERPEQFTRKFKSIFDDVQQPSGVVEINRTTQSAMVTSVDDGIIINGPSGYSVTDPKGVVYDPQGMSPDLPIQSYPYNYEDGTSILILIRPNSIPGNSPNWSGEWGIQGMRGTGELTYISPVHLNPQIPIRDEYFLNEVVPIKLELAMQVTRPGFDPQQVLAKCNAEYTIVYQGSAPVPPVSDTLTLDGSVFSGEVFLNHEGVYLLEVKLNIDRRPYRTYHKRFYVNNSPLFETQVDAFAKQPVVGSKFRIVGRQTFKGFQRAQSTVRGLKNEKMTVKLQYDTREIPIPGTIRRGSDGSYSSSDLEFTQDGKWTIVSVLTGDLVMQERGSDQLIEQPVQARAVAEVRVEKSLGAIIINEAINTGFTVLGMLGMLGGILAIIAFFRQRQWKSAGEAALISLMGARTIEPLSHWEDYSLKEKIRRLSKKMSVSLGGAESNADIKIRGSKNEIIAAFIPRGLKEFAIVRKGETKVSLNGEPIEPGQKYDVNGDDEIEIESGAKFKFSKE